ncbi:MAG: ferrochelatase [Mariprofundaceae bacterium]|nr:ferrochelatase [Mariprofundaceae bacterium]
MHEKQTIGLLLTNLGTPDAPTRSALRRYLKEFLSDPRVVEMNRSVWWLILNLVILNIRPAKSAHAYQSVWTEQGSPLMMHSLQQQEKLQAQLGDDVCVELAMRYGNPSIASGLEKLRAQGCGKILILPLYPQYAGASTGSTFDAVADILKTWRYVPGLRMINSYHDHPAYITALAASIRKHWQEHGKSERLLMSFHGIPQRYADQGDPYPNQCQKTAVLVAELLELEDKAWFVSFQSRFGKEAWLQPYTDATLRAWAKDGVQTVDVICPGFSADCLETLEEIGVENRGYFLKAGGKDLRYIPALNAQDEHIQALSRIVQQQLQGWVN